MTLRTLEISAVVGFVTWAAGCSSTASPAPRGATHVVPDGSVCGVGPYSIPKDGTPTTERAPGNMVTDASDGYGVRCTVRKGGGGYQITGSVDGNFSAFTITAQVEEGDGNYTGPGNVAFVDPGSGNVESSTCTVTVTADQQVKPGAVWGNFSCTDSVHESGKASCNFSGSFVFDRCDD